MRIAAIFPFINVYKYNNPKLFTSFEAKTIPGLYNQQAIYKDPFVQKYFIRSDLTGSRPTTVN